MMNNYGFHEQLKMSMESLQLETDALTLKNYFPEVCGVRKTDVDTDKSGIDYIITLKTGTEIGIDVKTRAKGCSKYWKGYPELALEVWSQKYPANMGYKNQIGWTLDTGKRCDYVMFKFDKSDSNVVYILPFQQLNKAFRKNIVSWRDSYKHEWQGQKTAQYKSGCIFVPANIVLDAVRSVFTGQLVTHQGGNDQ